MLDKLARYLGWKKTPGVEPSRQATWVAVAIVVLVLLLVPRLF